MPKADRGDSGDESAPPHRAINEEEAEQHRQKPGEDDR